eukprot:CAMPEP_0185325026 /NCGR_PEP_ID=MMETSP1363-20130426/65580_1 /TAXON_ID=38817 /ORGANISM="Gephyrocapsa oceanica, Strain RCC1303" /LENGTH=46 /DNA_ID= /DNA_START= /DNA_END= /DNA_ORIENTATION=
MTVPFMTEPRTPQHSMSRISSRGSDDEAHPSPHCGLPVAATITIHV